MLRFLPKIFSAILLLTFLFAKNGMSQHYFTENNGQWHESVQFRAETTGGYACLDDQGLTILQLEDDFYSKLHSWVRYPGADSVGFGHALKFNFIDANLNSEPEKENEAGYFQNFFLGNNKSKWASKVKAHERIKYSNVYPGIDLLHYSNKQNLKYDFIVHPNGETENFASKSSISISL